MTIQDTKAFGKLEPFQQGLINKRINRLQIEDAIVTARNIGVLELGKNNRPA